RRLKQRTEREGWRRRLHQQPTKLLNPTEKLVAEDLFAVFRGRERHGHSGDKSLWIEERARRLGISPETYGKALKTLAEIGVIERTETRDARTGHKRITVKPTPLFWDASNIARREERGYAYHPRACKKHPSAAVTEIRTSTQFQVAYEEIRHDFLCADCGEVIERTIEKRTVAGSRRTISMVTERRRVEEPPNPQLVDWVPSGTQPKNTGIVEVNQKENYGNTEVAEAVAELLCSIAGDDPTHIQLKPEGEAKYLTVPAPITTDLLKRHIAGEVMLGSTFKSADGKARSIRWEEDTPDGFARLCKAALKLEESGARPILERSPSKHHPGGGHLYLIFDARIDPAAGFATAMHWAPELSRVPEHWPNGSGRVRLPAGRYRRSDAHGYVDGWCEVWRPGGLHLTQDAAFNLLCERQTPAEWITVSPVPTRQDAPIPIASRQRRDSNGAWQRPDRFIPAGSRDNKLAQFACAMAAKAGMSGHEIFEELRWIRDELCEYVADDLITDASLRAKARSAVQKFSDGRREAIRG
ncbi:MAG TPA: hypothetical protein VKX16_14085, partial [Chloroflexota bacterium]|nr:hypothetical protein [Chloroflexota bacterium]